MSVYDQSIKNEDRLRAEKSKELMFFLCMGKNRLINFSPISMRENELKEKAIIKLGYSPIMRQ